MTTDHIRYDILAQDALRDVVRKVLTDAATHGLPGEHHFYITFETGADGVKISQRLKEQYPNDITIILQHQFWDLSVSEDRFEVGLSFGGVPEKLSVPFAAIQRFFDPSVQFALQFETVEVEVPVEDGAEAAPEAPKAVTEDASAGTGKPLENEAESTGAEVVRLDRFRKK